MALGRQIAVLLSLLLAAFAVGCGGSEETTNAEIDPVDSVAISEKLAQVQERFDLGDCTGDDSAESSLETLQEQLDGELLAGESEDFKADLDELLNALGEQIAADCVPSAADSDQTEETSSSTEEEPTVETTTQTETTETTTETDTEPEPDDTQPTQPEEPTVPDDEVPPGQGGTVPGTGGIAPGGASK